MFILFPSAFEFWMHVDSNDFSEYIDSSLGDCAYDLDAAEYLIQNYHISKPVHIGVRYSYYRGGSPDYVSHVLPKNIPVNSFVKIRKDLYVCRPELCFLLACSKGTIAENVKIANDLCSAFCIDTNSRFGFSRRKPITSVDMICNYLSKSKSAYGVQMAITAIKYAVDNAYSPFESKIAAIGFLPLRYGGAGLPKATLNYEVRLSPNAAKHLGRDYCCCDFVWPKLRVILEYDSNASHLEEDQHAYDKGKATALNESGYLLITATYKDFQNYIAVCNLFLMLRTNLKMKNRKDRIVATNDRRYEVFKQLFRSNKKYIY